MAGNEKQGRLRETLEELMSHLPLHHNQCQWNCLLQRQTPGLR